MKNNLRIKSFYVITMIGYLFFTGSSLYAQPYPYQQEWGHVKNLFKKIEGTWQLKGEQAFEQWSYKNNEFVGRSYSFSGNDTIIIEKLKVYAEGRQPYYQAIVKDQNNGEPVNFKMTSCLNDKAIFKNLEHDFPTTITYELVEKNRLKATISGERNGKAESLEFDFTRID